MTIVLDRPVATVRTTVDLHLHSGVSDGDHDPAELARRCVSAGLRVVACTDHNSVAGVAGFRAVAEPAGLTVIPGCEISAFWGGRLVHCLAYLVDPDDPVFTRRLWSIHDDEVGWWRDWFALAADLGVEVPWEAELGADRVAYLGDYFDLFLRSAAHDPRFSGYTRGGSHDAFITDWCLPGKPLHVPRSWRPDLAEAVSWIHAAGGVAVLAHVGRIRDLDESAVSGIGLDGVEVWTTWHDTQHISAMLALCDRTGLIPTQGSDFHGERLKPWAPAPGLVPSAADDPMAIVDRLHERAQQIR